MVKLTQEKPAIFSIENKFRINFDFPLCISKGIRKWLHAELLSEQVGKNSVLRNRFQIRDLR